MPIDIFYALTLQIINAVAVGHQFFQLGVNAFVIGLHIDDGAQLGFAKKTIVFLLTTANADETARHGLQGIHGGGVAVELIEDGITAVHHLNILAEGYGTRHAQLYFRGVVLRDGFCGPQHDVGAFVFAAALVDADEKTQRALMGVCLQLAQHFGLGIDGERDVDGFLWKGWLVTHVILIQPCNDAIAVAGDEFVELPLGRSQPVFLFFDCVGIGSRFSADVEIAIAERFSCVQVCTQNQSIPMAQRMTRLLWRRR